MICTQDHSMTKTTSRPLTIGPEFINMGEPEKEYINLFDGKTSRTNSLISGKREPPPPPPPPKQPIPKPRLNVTLSTEETKKKRPVPQPRSLVSKSTSASKLISMSSEVQPVPSVNVKIFKRYPTSQADPPLPLVPPPPPPGAESMQAMSSSSSSGEEGEFCPPVTPPALP